MSKRPLEDTVDTGDAQERAAGENSRAGTAAVAQKGGEPSFKNPNFQL